jgi:hypothetical protein
MAPKGEHIRRVLTPPNIPNQPPQGDFAVALLDAMGPELAKPAHEVGVAGDLRSEIRCDLRSEICGPSMMYRRQLPQSTRLPQTTPQPTAGLRGHPQPPAAPGAAVERGARRRRRHAGAAAGAQGAGGGGAGGARVLGVLGATVPSYACVCVYWWGFSLLVFNS